MGTMQKRLAYEKGKFKATKRLSSECSRIKTPQGFLQQFTRSFLIESFYSWPFKRQSCWWVCIELQVLRTARPNWSWWKRRQFTFTPQSVSVTNIVIQSVCQHVRVSSTSFGRNSLFNSNISSKHLHPLIICEKVFSKDVYDINTPRQKLANGPH